MDIRKKMLHLGFLNRIFGKRVVHVEAPHIFGEKLKKYLLKHRSKCYCLTPANHEYINGSFGIKISRREFHNYLKGYYLELKNKKINLQVHVHLSMFPETLSYGKKEEIIKKAYDFFVKDLGIVPKEIVFGWYASDREAEEIAHKLNLKIIKEHLHLYDWWMK